MRFFLKILLSFSLFAALPAFAELSPEKLAQELSARVERVPEFEFIRAEAEKLGVKVYLFGGTAASYGHYVREDLLREAGDKRFPAHRFDYDYTNIFRSTQDLDVVVDGSIEQAEKLEKILKEKFPHFIGDKSAEWEVRPLRVARGDKEAILGNPNFLNQHTDSHSTGLVEISKPKVGELGVRDVRDWDSAKPQFLKDVAEAKLHYYFNPRHGQTERALKGLNPPILSVIRYLTKAFQYGLDLRPDDQLKIREIVKDFKPSDINNEYLRRWVEKNGKKLFQHSMDVENSWNVLEDLGLREKIGAIRNNPSELNSLSWWMSKEPLRSEIVGRGTGSTAAQIFSEKKISSLFLAHETNSYLAYESITRDRAGELNAFISRRGSEGEAAAHGDGFYTAFGRKGARGTGLTIRMELLPSAKEGSDFKLVDEYVLLTNKRAVKVLSEKIMLSPLEYFRMLAVGKEFSNDDRALLETFKRRVARTGMMTPEDKSELVSIVREAAFRPNDKSSTLLLREWFSLPESTKNLEIVELMRAKGLTDKDFTTLVLSNPNWKNHPQWAGWMDEIIAGGKADLEIVVALAERADIASLPKLVSWIDILLARGKVNEKIGTDILRNPTLGSLAEFPRWLNVVLPDMSGPAGFALFTLDHSINTPAFDQWIESKIAAKNGYETSYAFKSPEVVKNPNFSRWMDKILGFSEDNFSNPERRLFVHPHIRNHPESFRWLEKRIKLQKELPFLVEVLGQEGMSHHPDFPKMIRAVLKQPNGEMYLFRELLLDAGSIDFSQVVVEMVRSGTVKASFLDRVLTISHLKNNLRLKALVGPHSSVNYINLRWALGRISPVERLMNETSAKCGILFSKIKNSLYPSGIR